MSELTFKSLPAAAKTIFITDITEYGAARVATCSCSLSGCWEFWSVQSSGWEQPITWVGFTFVHWSLCFKWSCYFWLLHGLGLFESGRTMPPAHKQDSVPLRIFIESTGSTAPTYTFELGYRRSFTCRGLLPTWDLKKRYMGEKIDTKCGNAEDGAASGRHWSGWHGAAYPSPRWYPAMLSQ